MTNQTNTATEYNRYPEIFNLVSKIHKESSNISSFNSKKNILSFGCSTGEEIQTLKDIYLPKDEIYGVEINEKCIEICTNKFGKEKIIKYHDFLIDDKKFDIIFAMSVLCKWEDTQLINDSNGIYPFKIFNDSLSILDSKLISGGILVLYNCNYCFFESSVYHKYCPITTNDISDSGFVHKFNSKNKKIDINYRDVIFKKK